MRDWPVVLLLLLLLIVSPTASGERVDLRLALEEQSACRTLDHRYYVAFRLRASYEAASDIPVALAVDEGYVTGATVWYDEQTRAAFVHTGLDADLALPPTRDWRTVLVTPGHAVAGDLSTWVPLSTEPADWPAALLPGDYRVGFEVQVPAVDDGRPAWLSLDAPLLTVHVPDPSSVQECPFEGAPHNGLAAP